MATIDIRPASPGTYDDAAHVFGGGGDGRSCQCQWWTLPAACFSQSTQPERADLMRREIDEAQVAPALIAYVDGEAVGWARVGPRTAQTRLRRTREFAATASGDWDDPQVWAITCFVVRKEHRREGVTRSLLDAAVQHAARHGARTIEAYPVDPPEARRSSELFRGVLSTFLEAGFHEDARTRPDRAIVSLAVSP